MKTSAFAILAFAALATQAYSDVTKTAIAEAPAISATVTAAPLSPTPIVIAQPVSPVAVAESEPEIEDDAVPVSPSAALDLAKAETRLLAKISESLGSVQEKILFNVEENAPAEKPGNGVCEVEAHALYLELARRAVAEEKEARQALSLAIVKGDQRAQDAKTEAFEERLASSLIKRIENGDKGAKDDLMKQALSGNKNARLYLGLDKPVAVAVPEALSMTTQAPESSAPVSATAKPADAEPKAPANMKGH